MLFLAVSVFYVNIGIDVGSHFFKSSIVTPDTTSSPTIGPTIPGFVSFRARPAFNNSIKRTITPDDVDLLQFEYGEKSLNAMNVRPTSGGGYFTVFAGLTQRAASAIAAKLAVVPQPSRVRLVDQIALFQNSYLKQITKDGELGQVVLVFPAAFTIMQRMAFQHSIPSTANQTVIDDAEAVARTYLHTVFKGDTKTVLFIDIGATSVKSYAVKFETQNGRPTAYRLSYSFDFEHGGAFVTKALADSIKSTIELANTTLAEDRRLFSAAEKAKIAFSASDSFDFILDNVGGFDHPLTIERKTLEALDAFSDLKTAILKLARNASRGISVDEIELIGGSSRLPTLPEAIAQGFQNAKVLRSLDADTALATGAGLRILKPDQKVESRAQLFGADVSLNWDSEVLCVPGEPCQARVSKYGMMRTASVTYTGGPLHPGLESLSQDYRISLNLHGNVTLIFDSAPLALAAVERCNKSCMWGRFRPSVHEPYSAEILGLFLDPDARILRLEKVRTELGELSTQILNDLARNETMRLYTNHTMRLEIIRVAEGAKRWMELPAVKELNDARNFSERLGVLKKSMARVYARMEDNATFWDIAGRIYNAVQMARQVAEKGPDSGFKPDPKEVYKFLQRLNKVEEWFNQTVNKTHETPLWLPLPVRIKVMRDKFYELEHDVDFFQNNVQAGPRVPKDGAGSDLQDERMEKLQRYQSEKAKLGRQSREMEEEGGDLRTGPKYDPWLDAGL
jgi:hypothetical protein